MASMDLKKKIRGYSNAMNASEYEAALDNYYTQKRNDEEITRLKDRSAEDQWLENEKIRQLQITQQVDAYDKNAKVYETTLDAIDLAARDAEDRVRLGLDEQIAEFAFQVDDLQRDMIKESMQAGLQYDQQEQSLEAARLTDDITQKNIQLERRFKKKQYEEQLLRSSYDKKLNKSEKYKAKFDENLERIKATGAARARGQLGNSTKRAVSTVEALSGVNQKQIDDNLYYSQQTIESQRRDIKQDRRKTLGKQYDKINGAQNLSIKQAAKQMGTLGLQSKESFKRKRLTKKSVRREQKNIAKNLGITEQEFNMSRKKLAESLRSASAQSELKLKNIATKEFEAKGQAYAQKMVAPRFGSTLPKPYKVPQTQFTLPQPAPKTPMMQGGMGRTMNRGSSGASIAMGLGGAALTAAGTVMTGGAAPFVMGAGALLGGISSLFS